MKQRPLPFDSDNPSKPEGTGGSPGAVDGPECLDEVRRSAVSCQRCKLRQGASQVVFGHGHPRARIMLIGEGPGRDEDIQGIPFVGRAGKLLDRILEAAGFNRDQVYITNVVKCRPPGNRAPTMQEINSCLPWLKRQVSLVDPYLILLLGRTPAQALLGSGVAISRVRGRWHSWEGYMILPTYHPAALLRDPSKKVPTWKDVQELLRAYAELGLGGKSSHA